MQGRGNRLAQTSAALLPMFPPTATIDAVWIFPDRLFYAGL